MKAKLFIRAAVSANIGLGHLMRSIALAEILKDEFEIIFIITKIEDKIKELIKQVTSEIITIDTKDILQECEILKQHVGKNDVLVIDGYDFKSEYQKNIKSDIRCKLVAIDDMIGWHQYADAVINHAVGDVENLYSRENYTQIFCGLDYALLRKEFRNLDSNVKKKETGTVVVAMGGADPLNYTAKIIKNLITGKNIKTIKALIGKLNPNREILKGLVRVAGENGKNLEIIDHLSAQELIDVYNSSVACILSASGMAIEALAVGANLGVIKTAGNQNYFYEYIKTKQLAIDCNSLAETNTNTVQETIDLLMKGTENKKRIDAKSNAQRITNIFKTLNN